MLFLLLLLCPRLFAQNGIHHVSFGAPDKLTPYSLCAAKPMTADLPAGSVPFDLKDIHIRVNARGTVVEIPLDASEHVYGFGLQFGSFDQRGLKKRPIVNDNPLNNLGYTHGPTTFYLSSKGYGILINTARYTTFYCGAPRPGYVTVDIPGARGIDLFVFDGPDMLTAMRRYILFSGGGALPAIWGLGVKYRVKADFDQSQVDTMAAYFRAHDIPCDVLGLEPRWQTAAYSCSYVWDEQRFPTHDLFIDSLGKLGFHLNLWEHAFTNPKAPIYDALKDKVGDYPVWGGLVPDFADSAARRIFADYHRWTFAERGISGFKLDECDNSNLADGGSTWSFPELSRFPSGLSGEQMHQVFGLLYQKTIYDIYHRLNRRTYLDARASGDFAASYPASLYSDTYDHDEYIRLTVNSGFAGMLWSPEVRESRSVADLLRRTQTAVLSAQTLFNSWYLQHPPWLQIDKEKNNRNELMDSARYVEGVIRKLLDLRMSLVPYLYNAFADYHFKGIPPFRALVLDYPTDKNVFDVSNEYLIGTGLLAAPLTAADTARSVYLPEGAWYDFNTHERYEGGRTYVIRPGLDELPLFVKAGTILPLARPLPYIPRGFRFDVTCYVFGDGEARGELFGDDGYTFDYEKGAFEKTVLRWQNGRGSVSGNGAGYTIGDWIVIH